MRRTVLLAILASMVATPSGATTIAELVSNAASLAGQQVTVTGAVVEPRADLYGETTFNVRDAAGQRVGVFGKGSAPALGTTVSVTGTVGYRPPDEEFTWPPVLHAATW